MRQTKFGAGLSRRKLLAMAATSGLAVAAGPRLALARDPSAPHSLDEFFAPSGTRGASLSPSGARIAVLEQIGDRNSPRGAVDILQADDPEGPRRRIPLGPVEVDLLEWASDNRLLVRVILTREIDGRAPTGTNIAADPLEYRVRRVVSVHADTGEIVVLFSNERRRMRATFDMGQIVDLLPQDPDHVMMSAWEDNGSLALHKVNINTGVAQLVERGSRNTWRWRTVDGVAVLRHDVNARGTMETIYVRGEGATEWRAARQSRIREAPEFAWVGPGDTPGKVLVIARHDSEDVLSVREMDLSTTALGPPLNARVGRDVVYGSQDLAGRYVGAAYYGDRLEYEFNEPGLAAHHRALNRFFKDESDVHLTDIDTSRNRLIARVSGPREPGAWYFYDRTAKAVVNLGVASQLDPARMGGTEVLKVATRDGAQIEAYLTAPPGGAPGPLVVLPHGGPEARDTPAWNRQVQALAAQGWWVLRPNFRGSAGYGQAFAREGWTRWGDRMQEDVEDAVAHAIAAKGLDAARVGIIGTSYGAYAALMGAVRRPELYKAAVGICGVYDLPDVLAWEERTDDLPDKPIYQFWTRRIGDRQSMGPALEAASPRRRASGIGCPVLLVHGVEDQVLPVAQSRRMRDALREAGKAVELIEVQRAGHADWDDVREQELTTRYVEMFRTAFA